MAIPNRPAFRFTRLIAAHRLLIPILLSALGFGYTIWESILWDGYSILSAQVLVGWALLGIAGPLLAFASLTFAARAAAEREQAEQERERQHQQLVALNQIGEAVNQSLDLEAVLNRTIDQVLSLMHLESGEVRLIEGGQLVLHASRGVSREFLDTESSVPLGQCVCGKSAQRGELIAVEDLDLIPSLERAACSCERFRSVLSVPVRTADRVVGAIHVASRAPRKFDAADRTLLTAIGYQVGVAIEKARLHAQLKTMNQQLEARVVARTSELLAAKEELAVKADELQQVLVEERRVEEKTRKHIAHDLHDSVQQLIIGALFETQAARDALALHPEASVGRIAAAQELLRQIEAEMRHAIYSLRPVTLDTHGLVPALRECADGFQRVAQIQCELQVDGTPQRFDPDIEVAVFRITQEALNNIEAHARARRVHLRVAWGVRELRLEVEDDGAGFALSEVTQAARTHLGLIGMRERAESVGGTLEVWSRVGEGTRVSVNVPLEKREIVKRDP
ncbi:MAG: GAF domain-containing sensor histidine kinase [Chloroflexota bacterium]|nr:GAF domain-containing sensor histidine kinase [Chloroflexota bacterium]